MGFGNSRMGQDVTVDAPWDYVTGADLWDESAFGKTLANMKVQADSALWKPEYANLTYGMLPGTQVQAPTAADYFKSTGYGAGNGTLWLGNAKDPSSYYSSLSENVSTPLFSQMRKLFDQSGNEGGYYLPSSLLTMQGGGDDRWYNKGLPADLSDRLKNNAYAAEVANQTGFIFPSWQNYLNTFGDTSVGAEGTGGLVTQHDWVTRSGGGGLLGSIGSFLGEIPVVGDVLEGVGSLLMEMGPLTQVAALATGNPYLAAVSAGTQLGQGNVIGAALPYAAPYLSEAAGGLFGSGEAAAMPLDQVGALSAENIGIPYAENFGMPDPLAGQFANYSPIDGSQYLIDGSYGSNLANLYDVQAPAPVADANITPVSFGDKMNQVGTLLSEGNLANAGSILGETLGLNTLGAGLQKAIEKNPFQVASMGMAAANILGSKMKDSKAEDDTYQSGPIDKATVNKYGSIQDAINMSGNPKYQGFQSLGGSADVQKRLNKMKGLL